MYVKNHQIDNHPQDVRVDDEEWHALDMFICFFLFRYYSPFAVIHFQKELSISRPMARFDVFFFSLVFLLLLFDG